MLETFSEPELSDRRDSAPYERARGHYRPREGLPPRLACSLPFRVGSSRGLASLAALGAAASIVVGACTSPSTAPQASPADTATGPILSAPGEAPAPLPKAARSSRLVVTADALWAGHSASKTVTKLSLPTGSRAWQTPVSCDPASLASSGTTIYVACTDTGEVVALDASTGAVQRRARVGSSVFGLLLAGGRLYATLEHDNALAVLRPDTLAPAARAATGREPRGMALLGGVLYVAHYFDSSVRSYALPDLVPGVVGTTAAAEFTEEITPSPTKPRLYITYQRPMTANMDRKFNNTLFPFVAPLETTELSAVRSEVLSLDTVDTPVGMPIATVLDAAGDRIYIANAMSSDVSVVDLASGFRAAHVLVGDHPRDLALSPDGSRLYTLNVVSDDVTVVDTAKNEVAATLTLATDPRPAIIQKGERLFLVSRPETLSKDRWMTCGSCHFDGGTDGQTWLGEPFGARNTPILRGVKGTQPFHWSADFPRIQDANPFIQGQLGGTGIADDELEALAAFIEGLTPIPSPLRAADGKLTQEAVRGAALFEKAECTKCHVSPLMTDRQLRDVGTGAPTIENPLGGGKIAEKRGTAFKTPPLRELWLTAPYLHDGRAKTLREVLTTYNAGDKHGKTGGLSERDLSDLEAFLLSLPLKESDRDQLTTR